MLQYIKTTRFSIFCNSFKSIKSSTYAVEKENFPLIQTLFFVFKGDYNA